MDLWYGAAGFKEENMRPAVTLDCKVPARAARLRADIATWMPDIPNAPPEVCGRGLWSCHALVRAAFRKWHLANDDWTVVDGWFAEKHTTHSWLRHGQSRRDLFILDPYPWCSLGNPILMFAGQMSPWEKLYMPRPQAYSAGEIARFDTHANMLLSLAL